MSQLGDAPADVPPYEPPQPSDVSIPLTQAGEEYAAAVQQVYDHLVNLLDEASQTYDAAIGQLRQRVAELARAAEGVYRQAGDVVSNQALTMIGFADAMGQLAGIPPVDPAAVRNVATSQPFPGGGLPQLPPPPVPIGAVVPGQLPREGFQNTYLTLPATPGLPVQWGNLVRPEPPPAEPAYVPSAPAPAPPPTSYVPWGTAPEPPAGGNVLFSKPSPGQPAAPPATSAGGPPPPATTAYGGDYVPMAGPLFVGQHPGSGLGSVGAGPAGSAGGAAPLSAVPAVPGATPAPAPCPPVSVTIVCAPGATASAQAAGGQVTVNRTDGPPAAPAPPAADQGDQGDAGFKIGQEGFRKGREEPPAVEGGGGRAGRPTCDVPTTRELLNLWTTAFGSVPGNNERLCEGLGGNLLAWQRAIDGAVCWLTGSASGWQLNDGSAIRDVTGSWPEWLRWFPEFWAMNGVRLIQILPTLFNLITGCDGRMYIPLSILRGAFGAIEKWVGAPFPEVTGRLDQLCHMLCPNEMPGPEDANGAWLMNEINQETWECWVKAAGMDPAAMLKVRNAAEVRPNALQAVEVGMRRGQTADTIKLNLNYIGVRSPEFQQQFLDLVKYVPGPGDLVTFMTRDVFDQAVVDKYKYDDEFPTKFSGKARDWAYANGMTEEQFLYYWRAHWTLPSPTQGYEMIRRLRPGRVDAEVVTDKETVTELLKVADVPKFWRDRLIEISYQPLTRTDTRRAFFIGAFSEDETYQAIQDQGYNERDAALLLRYWTQEKSTWLTRQPYGRDYVAGYLSDADLDDEFDRRQVRPEDRAAIRVDLAEQSQRASKKVKVRALQKRVRRGLTDRAEAVTELVELGYRDARAEPLVDGWIAERRASGRLATAGQLCKWYDQHLLDDEEYVEALRQLGYAPDSIGRIVGSCRRSIQDKLLAKEERKAAAVERQAKRELSEEGRRALQQNARAARAARAGLMAQRAEQRTQQHLAAAAAELALKLGGLPERYDEGVRAWFTDLVNEKRYTREGAASFVSRVLVDSAGRAGPAWRERGDQLVDLLPALELPLAPPPPDLPASVVPQIAGPPPPPEGPPGP